MEAKGTAIKSVMNYVMDKYKDRYLDWFRSLSDKSQSILTNVVTSGWYDVDLALVEPTAKLGEMFYDGNTELAAWNLGKYSAEVSLKGIYKIYVRASNPSHVIARGGRIMSAYYRPSNLEVVNKRPNSIGIEISGFDKPNSVIENRVGGWVESALQISGCKNLDVKITQKATSGNVQTKYYCEWSN